jgi:hypothetical protein
MGSSMWCGMGVSGWVVVGGQRSEEMWRWVVSESAVSIQTVRSSSVMNSVRCDASRSAIVGAGSEGGGGVTWFGNRGVVQEERSVDTGLSVFSPARRLIHWPGSEHDG